MTIKTILGKVRYHCPTTPEEFTERTGLQLIKLGQGSFRIVYQIKGTDLVIKFPIPHISGKDHSQTEIQRLREIFRYKKYRHLKRYAPKLYYSDYQNGVLILPKFRRRGRGSRKLSKLIGKAFCCAEDESGVEFYNLGTNTEGQIKLLDWGCVG